MSEAIPGITYAPPPAAMRAAAAVILVREGEHGQEVFWVRRGEKVSFSGGFYAFPGGRLDAADAAVSIAFASDDAASCVCAIRETFEESGVLLAPGADAIAADRREAMRRELLDGASFAALLAREGIALDARALTPAGRWVTPPFSPIRYDARFFLATVPRDTVARVIPGELTDGAWVRPDDALRRWEDGSALLHPPNLHAMRTLARRASRDAIDDLLHPPHVDEHGVSTRIEFQHGIVFLPLRTPTLPPAQHTNCYLAGTGDLAIVDPGSPYPDELDLCEARVRGLADEGRRAAKVLLTHHHRDHVGGSAIGARLGIPVLGHATTAARTSSVEGTLGDGDVIELGGPRAMRMRCLLTEGHALGHLCFLDEASRALFAGDMVAGGSTIVIDPPEGDMGVYLESLTRLLDLGIGTIYPAHGMPIPDGPATLREYLSHREARIAQVEEAVRAGVDDVPSIVARVYTDTHPAMYPVAERSALASLLLLARRGAVRARGDRWEPAA